MPPFSSPLAPSTLQLPYVCRIPPRTPSSTLNKSESTCPTTCVCFPAAGRQSGGGASLHRKIVGERCFSDREIVGKGRRGGGGGGVPWETVGRRCLPATGRQSGRGVSPKHGDNRGEMFPRETVGGGVSLQYGGSRGEVFSCNREIIGERRFPATGR